MDLPSLVENVRVVSDFIFATDPVFSSGAKSANTGLLSGHARIFSSGPRIMLAPFLLCKTGGEGSFEGVTPLPATPRGATPSILLEALQQRRS